MSQRYTVALVGNPNCGKTTLFNALTGSRHRVGNWPGVTVEKKTGEFSHDAIEFEVVDLPGTYSLDVVGHDISIDERLARDYIHSNEACLIVNVVDASNLERNLYLTTQLAEMGAPLLVVLNMIDMAESKGLRVDADVLAARLDCSVAAVVASSRQGIEDLKAMIRTKVAGSRHARADVRYDAELERAVTEFSRRVAGSAGDSGVSPRWLAVRLLEGDDLARGRVGPDLADEASQRAEALGDDLDIRIADARYTWVNHIARDVVTDTGRASRNLTEHIDRVVLNRVLGIPIFLLMMYLMFLFTINIGGAFIDFFDQAGGALLVDGVGDWLGRLRAPAWLELILAKGIGGGMQVVATFIPIIGFLFLFLSVLEDSGYMSRAAFVMDRFMRWLGLPGKSFVPLIVGFGCNVPAIMATRTLENRRDRLMTIAMAPFMSCGARLPVYVLFATAFFPDSAQNVVFGLYVIGIGVAVITGLVLNNTLLAEGDPVPFIMELPPYHLPSVRGVLTHAWGRLKDFITRAGRVIVPMVLVLNVLNSAGTDGSFGNENTEKSLLASVGRTIAPTFSPFGLERENWPAAVGVFTGVLAKEAIVGTLNAAYSAMAGAIDSRESDAFDLMAALKAALATIPANLAEAMAGWLDPLGLDIGDLNDQTASAAEQKISAGTFGAMASRFHGEAGAFAYLLFILLYMPCTAAVAAIYQEAGARWALFVTLWTTGLGYGVATLYFQAATWDSHPASSAQWIALVVVALGLVLLGMRRYGLRQPPPPLVAHHRT